VLPAHENINSLNLFEMKRFIYKGLLIILLLNVGMPDCFTQKMKLIKLAGIKSKSGKIADNSLSVFFMVDTIQNSADGLVFSLKFVNDASKDTVVKNPIDFLQVLLANEQGNNISIPHAPKALINTRDENENETFFIKSVMVNGAPVSMGILSQETLTIPANSTLEIALQIDNVLATQNGIPVSPPSQVKISPGTYRLGITLSLIGVGDTSEVFQTSPVSITLN